MKIHKLLIAGVISTVLLFNDCGNSSEVLVPATISDYKIVKGTIFNLNGIPAHGAIVRAQAKNTLADTSEISLKKVNSSITCTVTDLKGEFTITLNNGTYTIECCDSNNISIYETVMVEDPDLTVSLPPDTLKPSGAINGVVRFAGEEDPAKSLVLAFGVDRFACVESDGAFILKGLAEGLYNLRIIPSAKNYRVLDTTNIRVNSGGTTSLGILKLP